MFCKKPLGSNQVGGGGMFALEAGLWTVPTGFGYVGAPAFVAWFFLRTIGKVRIGGGARGGAPGSGDDAPGSGDEGDIVRFRFKDLRSIRLLPDSGDTGFAVELRKLTRRARFEGEDARRVAAAVISGFNPAGGPRHVVRQATREVKASGHPSRFAATVARRRHKKWLRGEGSIASFPHSTKLALEMALHEERERRALEGELWVLEQAWKEAEEIASISDSLLLPAGTDEFFKRHGREGAPTKAVFLLALGCLGGPACQPDVDSVAGTATEERDSAGIRIVENPRPPDGSRLGWRIGPAPSASIGEIDGGELYALHRAYDATRLSDGRIVVANNSSGELRVYDASGTHLADWGGRGEGPGEFGRDLTRVARWAGDSIVAWYSRFETGIHVFDGNGRFGRSLGMRSPSGVSLSKEA